MYFTSCRHHCRMRRCLILCRGGNHTAINRQTIHPKQSPDISIPFIKLVEIHQEGREIAMTSTTTIAISISGIPRCPISHERLQDPVILDCICKGTISRSSFVAWYQHQDAASTGTNGRVPRNCRICGSELRSIHVVPNVPLREILEAIISSSTVDEPTSPIRTALRARTRKQVGQDW
jgi:hypothetical protein